MLLFAHIYTVGSDIISQGLGALIFLMLIFLYFSRDYVILKQNYESYI